MTIGFGFTSDWLSMWREIFKPIRELNVVKQPESIGHSIENNKLIIIVILGTHLHVRCLFLFFGFEQLKDVIKMSEANKLLSIYT